MTEKQEKILFTALELFAKQGYHAVSTSKIAKQAGVSEALIFRHFENKEGLLNAILQKAEDKTKVVFADIIMTVEPKELIRKILALPFSFPMDEIEMWRLVYALKWQTNSYNSQKLEPLKLSLSNAFEKLGYDDPKAEAEIILMFLDGIATAMLLHEPENKPEVLNALLKKYNL